MYSVSRITSPSPHSAQVYVPLPFDDTTLEHVYEKIIKGKGVTSSFVSVRVDSLTFISSSPTFKLLSQFYRSRFKTNLKIRSFRSRSHQSRVLYGSGPPSISFQASCNILVTTVFPPFSPHGSCGPTGVVLSFMGFHLFPVWSIPRSLWSLPPGSIWGDTPDSHGGPSLSISRKGGNTDK